VPAESEKIAVILALTDKDRRNMAFEGSKPRTPEYWKVESPNVGLQIQENKTS
jgi:hypothetical protein